MRSTVILAASLAALAVPVHAQDAGGPPAEELPSLALEQLRSVIGSWDVTTEFLRPDGSVAGAFDGTYTFEWVMKDRIVKGMSEIPEFEMASGILFYLRESTDEVEMVSVGKDGQLWTMTGPDTSETRETPVVEMPDGTSLKLRFTRYNVSQDRFESRMDRSTDGGESWVPGNHQVFARKGTDSAAALDALRPLAGACWKGMFGEGPAYDVMCVEEMAGGFLKSRHTVRGIDGSYSGETIYYLDPVTRQARYTYYTSLGAVQRGSIAMGEAEVRFEDIVHVTSDGSELLFRGTGQIQPDGSYRATTSQWQGGEWQEPGIIVFTKIDCSSWAEVEAGCD